MRYINPLSLLDLPDGSSVETITPSFLRQQKRRLLAEFDLASETTIQVSGHELDKATMLKLFDEQAEEELQQVHWKIQRLPELEAFLEEASLTYFYKGHIRELEGESRELLTYIGPYFAHSYNQRLLNSFKQRD